MKSLTVDEAASLRSRALSGDAGARRELGDSVLGYVYRLANRRHRAFGFSSAEEAVGKAMERILSHGVEAYNPDRGARWVTYAGHLAADEIRRGPGRRKTAVDAMDRVDYAYHEGVAFGREPDAEDVAIASEVVDLVRDAVESLPEAIRAPAVLRYGLDGGGERQVYQIAALTGMTRAQVVEALRAARSILSSNETLKGVR